MCRVIPETFRVTYENSYIHRNGTGARAPRARRHAAGPLLGAPRAARGAARRESHSCLASRDSAARVQPRRARRRSSVFGAVAGYGSSSRSCHRRVAEGPLRVCGREDEQGRRALRVALAEEGVRGARVRAAGALLGARLALEVEEGLDRSRQPGLQNAVRGRVGLAPGLAFGFASALGLAV